MSNTNNIHTTAITAAYQPGWNSEAVTSLRSEETGFYCDGFSAGYREDFSTERAIDDIALIAKLDGNNAIALSLYREVSDPSNIVRFRVVRNAEPIALSDMLPVLENFGLRVIGERPYPISRRSGENYWLHEFELEFSAASNLSAETTDIETLAPAFEAAVQKIWQGVAESDLFNQLVLTNKLDWRSVMLLRAYANYMKQIARPYTRPTIARTLAKYYTITDALVRLFDSRFNPTHGADAQQRDVEGKVIEQSIIEALDEVDNLNEDQIIRQYLNLVTSTLRTNFYQPDDSSNEKKGHLRDYLSFKLDVNAIPDAPKPKPQFEIYVYSAAVEGVHLRGGKVARGGLRWSDRHEDFRTEILGLVKAQQVKNSVIVPMGAKGGFICKKPPAEQGREAFIANGVACYRTFISALLQLTDNLVDGNVVAPTAVVRWDEDDPYLVVAADKGTATFSDIANELSQAHGFWLGDAFASGGSVGYDHKKMGITAKGAWVSVQRHFRELGINVQQQDFSVVAVGDMAGDVFGNGMLCSRHICLLAAFNHQHIFIDPNPDSAASYAERERLFVTPGTSWDDYDRSLISEGGGVFLRSAKSIVMTPQMQQRFGISQSSLAPNDFINAILKAETDLFWNGGIGTYVKSSAETHADVGDRANDCLRVNGTELGAKVIGEGGNLGCTQLGRIEFALQGGRCNTDFIDNAGGVDCSDHEVNIKILLNQLMADAALDADQRNELLYAMTDKVSDLVLHNNYRQTQSISLAEAEASFRGIEYQRLIAHFESKGTLDRELEFMPSDETLHDRKAFGKALTRPELSVLVSYAKLALKQALADSDIADDTYLARSAFGAFPANLGDQYGESIERHQLHNEIVSTQLAGDLVNRMGITFIHRMQQATGEAESTIAKAYVTARDLFDIEQRWQAIEALDYKIDTDLQHELFFQLIRLVRRATRWLLRERRAQLNIAETLDSFAPTAAYVLNNAGKLIVGEQLADWQEKIDSYVSAGIPAELAEFVASARYLYNAFSIADVVARTGASVDSVAAYYAKLGERLELGWFADQIAQMNVDSYWQAMARESFRDDLEHQQAELVRNVVSNSGTDNIDTAVENWFVQHKPYIERWQHMTAELRCVAEFDLAMFPVAIRELLDLLQASEKAA